MTPRKRLGDILQDRGLLSSEQLQKALEMQRQTGERLGEAVVKLGYVTPDQIADALSHHLGIPRADLTRQYISNQVVALVPEELIKAYNVLPIDLNENRLRVAMVDPLNIMAIDDLQAVTGCMIEPLIATSEEIQEALQRSIDFSRAASKVVAQYEVEETAATEEVPTAQVLGDAPGVRLANMILQQGVREKASDIHLEFREDDMRVRFRVDGLLRDVMVVPRHLREDVKSRIKIMANLDITERRRPQDGRIQLTIDNMAVDMRVSTLPTVFGEKVVLRVLHKSKNAMSLEDFGFFPESLDRMRKMLVQSQGLILVTGPTGSGKTTTLYGFLNQLNDPTKNIITVEDPVEYFLDGISQVPVNPRTGLTFATGLRTVLRQDPDIIMVGEIRDTETAEIAMRSALTGHLVLSTLHTNSAIAAVPRLFDMGIEPYILSSTLIGVIAQRLVRKICPDCVERVKLTNPLVIRYLKSLSLPVPEYVFQGRGCPSCNDTGYKGRTAVEEVLLVNKALRDGIDARLSETELETIAKQHGFITLQENAAHKLTAGLTTAEEIIRTVYSVDDYEEEFYEGSRESS